MVKDLRIHFELPGEQRFKRLFQHLEHVPDDFREPFEKMAEDFWHEEEKTFAEEGPGWAPLATSTRWDRVYNGYPPAHPILVRSGALKASLTSGTDPNAVYEVYPDHLVLGTALKVPSGKYNLGAIHQYGATISRGGSTWRVPKRPPIKMTDTLQRKWENRMEHWLRDEIGWSG